MKTGSVFWNQLKWDLRYVWWALAAVVVLAPLQVWLEVGEYRGEWEVSRIGLSLMVWALMVLVAVVAVILVIQKDVPFGCREFLLSRPVGRGTLLGSKMAILSFLFVLLGVTFLGAPFLTGGVGRWGQFVSSFLVTSAWLLTLSASLAVISSSLVRMLYNGVIIAGGATVFFLLGKKRIFTREFDMQMMDSTIGLGPLIAFAVFLVLGGVGIVVRQYLSRSSRLGLSLVLGLLASGVGVLCFWPVASPVRYRGGVGEEFFRQVILKCDLNELKPTLVGDGMGSGRKFMKGRQLLACRAIVEKLPEGFSVEWAKAEGLLESDGELVRTSSEGIHWFKSWSRGTDELQDYQDLSWGAPLNSSQMTLGTLPLSIAESWEGRTLSYRGEGRVSVKKEVELARFPFGKDVDIETAGIRLAVSFGESFSKKLPTIEVQGSYWVPFLFPSSIHRNDFRFLIVNEKRKEFFECYGGTASRGRSGRIQFWRGGYGPLTGGQFVDKVTDKESWLADAFVILLIEKSRGMISQPVVLENFTMKDVITSY